MPNLRQIPFALQWIWPVPLFILITLAPESPWFLVRRGRFEEAEHSIKRLATESENLSPKEVIAMMIRTNEHEKAESAGASYLVSYRHRQR